MTIRIITSLVGDPNLNLHLPRLHPGRWATADNIHAFYVQFTHLSQMINLAKLSYFTFTKISLIYRGMSLPKKLPFRWPNQPMWGRVSTSSWRFCKACCVFSKPWWSWWYPHVSPGVTNWGPLLSWWFFTNPFEKYAQVKLDHFPR